MGTLTVLSLSLTLIAGNDQHVHQGGSVIYLEYAANWHPLAVKEKLRYVLVRARKKKNERLGI
jgi:hypothetical protein